MRAKILSIFIAMCCALFATHASAQTMPAGVLHQDTWCLTLPERTRVQAAYSELRIARQQLVLYQELDATSRNVLRIREEQLRAHAVVTQKASTIVERALAHSLAVEQARQSQEKLQQAQNRARRWRNVAIGVVSGAVAASAISLKVL